MNQSQQLELQKIVQAKNARAGEMFEQILNSELFPVERLSDQWRSAVATAVYNATPLSQKVGLGDFAKVLSVDVYEDGITLFQFGVLNNCLEAVSFNDLHLCSKKDYAQLMEETVINIKWYGERIAAIRKQIEIDVEQEFLMKATAGNGLRMVKGEA